MIKISNAFRRELYYDRRYYLTYADITLSNGKVLNLTNKEIWSGGFRIEDAVSSDDKFAALGSAIMNASTLIINNMYDDYSEYDFTGAKVVMYIGMQLDDNGISRLEKFKKGTYIVDDASYNGGTITLYNLDYMRKFEKPYSLSKLSYPATLDEIVRDACRVCGVSLNTYDFPHKDYSVPARPNDDAITFREVIAMAATIAGCFARCNTDGKLELKWFDQATLEARKQGLEGGSFDSSKPYRTGDNADGGTLNPWNTGYEYDGETFETERNIHYISSLYQQDIGIDDVVITGIKLSVNVESEEKGNETKVFTSGTEGYVIEIDNNDLIDAESAQKVADWLGLQLIGLTFRRASISHINDPSLEAGDVAVIWDRKGNEYPILITSTDFAIGQTQRTVSAAETPARNSATRYTEMTKSYVQARSMIQKEKSQREIQLEDLSERLAAKSGLYATKEETQSGTIYYLHDRPKLDDSNIVWKMTTEAFGVSTDGGKNWNAGLTVDGDMITRILSAIGVNADWITTGKIESKDGSVAIDLDKNTINLKGVTSFSGFAKTDDLKTAGKTTINGSNITTGVIQDSGKNTVINLSTGSITIKKGSINLGDGNFKVSTNGKLEAEGATINGTIRSKTSDSYVELNDGVLKGGSINYSGGRTQHGKITFTDSWTNGGKGMGLHSSYLSLCGTLYTSTNTNATSLSKGYTGSKKFVTSFSQDSSGVFHWTTSSMSFVNGLLVT